MNKQEIKDKLNIIFWKNVDIHGNRAMQKELFREVSDLIDVVRQQERERIIALVLSFEHDLSKEGLFKREVWKDIINKIKELK